MREWIPRRIAALQERLEAMELDAAHVRETGASER